MYKRFLCFALTFIMLVGVVVDVNATTISDVENKKNKAEENLNNVTGQISTITQRQEELANEIAEMDTQLVDILTSISICKDEIVAKEEEVSAAAEELKLAKEQEAKQYNVMKQRIKFLYEQGDSAYLQIFFESKSIGDMLNKASYVEKLYEYDNQLLENYQEKKAETEEKKNTLEEEEAELLATNNELQLEQLSLEQLISQKKATIKDFDTKLANAKVQAEKYKKELKEQTNQLRKLEEEKKAEEARKAEEAKKNQNTDASQDDAAGSQDADGGQDVNGTDNSQADGNQGGDGTDSSKPDDDKTDKPAADKGNASLGQQIADYGKRFVGNPYKFGGTSLTNGTDCSGFTMSVYAHFGISLPRDSTSQRSAGRAVSYEEAQPGDLICYAGHVALYIGGGQIVHASTEKTGIKYSNATYRTILAVRRIV